MKFIRPNWPAPKHIKAYTTSKLGWGGRKPYHDMNQGHYDGSNPNYRNESTQLKNLLNLPNEPIWITQTHSNIAIDAHPSNREQIADASFSSEAQQICIVLTADCLPVLLCDKSGAKIAAAHAGWRGLANGILEQTITQMKSAPEGLIAWFGPAISQNKFEVGSDVYHTFLNEFPNSKLAFRQHPEQREKWFADLYLLAKLRLANIGVRQIFGGGFCTYLQENLFFSYRRDQGKTGRMATLIWIDKN